MGEVTAAAQQPPAGEPTTRRKAPSKTRLVIDRLIITTLFASALAMSLYPLVAMYVNDRNAFNAAQEVTAVQDQTALEDPAATRRVLEEAHHYSQTLPKMMLDDPIISHDPNTTDAYSEYRQTLRGDEAPIGTLTIPAIGSSMPIFHGTSEAVLNQGVGHMFGTSLPVGGDGTHSVLSAHRGLPHLSGFDDLPDLVVGDTFFVKTLGQTMAYEVTETNVVLPNDLELVRPVVGEDLVTLVTCTPYAINTHRLLVTGKRVSMDEVPAAAKAQVEAPVFAWSLPPESGPRLAVAAAALLALLVMVGRWLTTDIVRPFFTRRMRARAGAVPATRKEPDMATTHLVPVSEGSASL